MNWQSVGRIKASMAMSRSDVEAMVAESVSAAVEPVKSELSAAVVHLRDSDDGRGQALRDDVRVAVVNEVKRVVAELPAPRNGRDGEDGKDADMGAVMARLSELVAQSMSTIQVPKNGSDGKDGRDGTGVTGAFIDRDGQLVLTLSDGATKTLGVVVGRDGERGESGQSIKGDKGEPGESIKGDQGPPGLDGKNGFDGVTMDVDDLTATEYDGERTVTLVFQRGDRVKRFPITFAIPIYRDIYEEGKSYEAGDIVTWGGSAFIAKTATSAKPGLSTEESRAWRLYVKRGRDGKPGKDGERGPQGPKGDPGPVRERW